MQSNFCITYSQPTFELPQKPIVPLADHASLAMVPRATADLNSSRAMESQLINPPPSPTCVESHSTITSTFPNNSFNDIMGQLMNQLVHEVDIMKFHQIMSNPLLTSIGYALAQSAMEKNHTPVEEEKYEEYTAQSLLHQDIVQASAAVTHQLCLV